MLSQEGTPPPSPPNEELSQQQELFQQAIYHTRETKNETLEIKITQAYKEWQALLQEKDQGERELDVMDKKIQKMKMEVGRLGLSRRYGVACRRVTDRTSAYDFVSAAKLLGPLKMVLKTHLGAAREGGEEGNVVETANVVLQPRQIKKMKSKLNSLQRSIIEGLESLAKDVQFLSQNDDDDVAFANAHPPHLKDFLSNSGTTVERSSAKAFYTIRIKSTKCEEDGHSDDDNVTTAEDVISAALDLGQESTVYRCIRHFAERIDREVIKPMITSFRESPLFRAHISRRSLPTCPLANHTVVIDGDDDDDGGAAAIPALEDWIKSGALEETSSTTNDESTSSTRDDDDDDDDGDDDDDDDYSHNATNKARSLSMKRKEVKETASPFQMWKIFRGTNPGDDDYDGGGSSSSSGKSSSSSIMLAIYELLPSSSSSSSADDDHVANNDKNGDRKDDQHKKGAFNAAAREQQQLLQQQAESSSSTTTTTMMMRMMSRFMKDLAEVVVEAGCSGIGRTRRRRRCSNSKESKCEEGSIMEAMGFAISGRIESMLVSKVLIPSMPIHVRDLHGFQSTASLCLREYRARWEMAGLAVPGGMTLKEANRKRVSKSIDQWLSGIEIGGREERRYDSTDIVNFATKEGLMDEIPEEIYRRYVEAKHKIGSEKAHTAKASSSSAAAASINHFGSGSGLGTNITTTTESPPLPDTIKEFPGQIPRLFMNRCQVTLLGAARAIIARCGYEEVTIVNNNNYNKPCYINTTINSNSSGGGGGDEDSTSIILGKFEQESWGILSAHGDKGSSSISSSRRRRRSADGGNRTTMTTKNKKNQTTTTTTTTTTTISRARPLQISEDMLRLVQLLYGICSLAEEAKKNISSSSSSIMESKDDEEERNQEEEQKVESASIMKIAVQVVQLYIALTLPTFTNQLATSNFCGSRRAAIIRNDTIFLAGHLASLHKFFASAEVRRKMRRKQWNMKSSEKLTIRSGRALRLIDLIPPVKALGTRVFSLQLDRLHALATAVLLPISTHNNTLTNLQIAARYRECRESVAEALEIPQRLASAWGPPPPRISNNNTSRGGGCGCVMPSKASCFIIGKFLEMTMESLVNGTLMAKDISQECAARIRTLMIQTIETIRKINFLYSEDNKGEGNYHRKIREGEDNLQQEGVYQYLDSYGKAMALFRILDEDQTLNSVRRAYNQGYLLALNPGEIKNVIKAIWTKSPKREALLATISQLPSNIPSSFSSSISVEI